VKYIENKKGNQYIILIGFIILFSLLSSCSISDRFTDADAIVENSMMVQPGSGIFESLKDSESFDPLYDGLWVNKTGRCRESKVNDGEVMCPVKGIYEDIEGWVFEYALIKFEDYLPWPEE